MEKKQYKRTLKTLKKGDFSFIDQKDKDSLHEFEANATRADFVDILFPDYDENKECKFFNKKS